MAQGAQLLVGKTATAVPITHTPREHQEYPGSQYMLPTDGEEHQRLVLQHKILKSLFDNRILLAPVKLNEQDRVLDIGTGPGLWILDLATSVSPSARMVAVDIESRLFPVSPPKNVEFRIESVANLPVEWSNSFSLVHQRLLMAALEIPQWPVALQEIHRVLRPDGWVQLAESTPWHEVEYPGKPCMEKLIALFWRVIEARNLYIDCAYDMPKMLADAGFVDIHSESRMQCLGKWAGETGVAMGKNHIGVLKGIKTPVLEAGGFGIVSTEQEYDELIEGLPKEWDETPGTEKEFIIFYARKPSKSQF